MNATHVGVLLLTLAPLGLASCGSAASPMSAAPSAPSPVPQPAPLPTLGSLVVFSESASGFSTTDLRDVEDQIVQFNTANELIWTADGTRLPGFFVDQVHYPGTSFIDVVGPSRVICPTGCSFEVRFGTKDGERRAYLTMDYVHDNPGTLVDVDVSAGVLKVARTNVFAPGTFTLSGTVTESTRAGLKPVEAVSVYRSVASGWRGAQTDQNGFYQIAGMYDGSDTVAASKDGYEKQSNEDVPIKGDTRYDIRLVRR
jgi:hypothetical protein